MNEDEIKKFVAGLRNMPTYSPKIEFEPSVDVIGYKILRVCDFCQRSSGKFILVSPQYDVHHWEGGQLEADDEPHPATMHGIHFAKSPNHPALRQYVWNSSRGIVHYLVGCILSGAVIETEWGYRAQHAEIKKMIEIENDYGRINPHGDWKSYQEVEYTETNRIRHRHSSPEEWERTPWRDGNPFIGTDSGS